MRFCWLILFVFFHFYSQGQNKSVFRIPSNLTPADYSSSYVLAKVKQANAGILQGSRSGRTSVGISSFQSAKHLIDENLLFKGRTSNGPRIDQSGVDMSLYYEIACTPGTSIEKFINDLNDTGYFEYVELANVHKVFLTPNDPAIVSQYYLTNINALQAWDITQGSANITIAIVDSGADFLHPDLIPNLFTNSKDPVDGIDNDGDGFLDDFRGWDFVGNDTLNVNNSNYLGDNDPQLKAGGNLGHGVSVAGCASASANNNIGIAGVGFKTKLMFTKHTADNQNPSRVSIFRGFSGILYAASKGAKIINCSWGGPSKSQIEQDIINYVTNDLGSLVVASAGNDGKVTDSYPAAYDNVLSVAATDNKNVRATFTSRGTSIDIAAPGVNIFTTAFGSDYTTISGTSFSSPITAGAAALVLAQNPTFTPQQIAEQLRVSSNAMELNNKNPTVVNQIGHGLLDIYQALTLSSPSLRSSNPKLLSSAGIVSQPGEHSFLTMTIKNNLKSTSTGVQITITSTSPLITVTKGTINPGLIAAGASITNSVVPFEVDLGANIPENSSVSLLVSYTDGAYVDSEYLTFLLNPSFIDVNQNLISTTVSTTGRIGYEDTDGNRVKGSGFIFNQSSILFEMGLIMGTSATTIYNNVRGAGSGYDNDFVTINKIKQIIPGDRSTSEIFGTISNSVTPASQAVVFDYRNLVWKDSPDEKFVIMEYKLRNPTSQTISNFHFGIFADWDISSAGDVAKWDNANKMGYVYPAKPSALPYAGIQLLTGTPEYYAIDNDQAIAGNPFGVYDGFTDLEKFQSISSGLTKITAGTTTAVGGDVSHVVSSGPYTISAGQEIKIAFALHAALNLTDLQTSARYADSIYNYTLNAPIPTIADTKVCYGTPATLNVSGATKYKWYKTFTGGTAFQTGAQFITPNLQNDTVFYISNADHTFESVRVPAKVTVKANPKISTSGSPAFCSGQSIILSAPDADTYLWSTGATSKTITVSAAASYTVKVTDATLNCVSQSSPLVVTVNPNPTSLFTTSTGGALITNAPIAFTNQSTSAASSVWDFGDNTISTQTSPSHTYTTASNYTVKLTAYSDKGCQNLSSKSISVITGLDDINRLSAFETYPNPFVSSFSVRVQNENSGPISVTIFDLLGNRIYQTEGGLGRPSAIFEIPATQMSEGIYIVHVKRDDRILTQKVVKSR